MTAMSDKAQEYRRRAHYLSEAAESLKDADLRNTARGLAHEWIVLAERIEAGVRHIFSQPSAEQSPQK
jgi:hypothetical protein